MNRKHRMCVLVAVVVFGCLVSHVRAEDAKTTTVTIPDPQPKTLQIFLLTGQSNMAGRAGYKGHEYVIPGVYLLTRDNNVWETAKNGFNRQSQAKKNKSYQGMNPGYGFVLALRKANPNQEIGIICNARGGSKLEDWNSSKSIGYNQLLERTKIAEKSGTLAGVLWHQGESDEKNGNYLVQLTSFIARLRKDLGNEKLPFIAGHIARVPLINDQLDKLPETVPFTAVAEGKDLKTQDRWHFNTESMLKLGANYGKAYLDLMEKHKKTNDR